MSDKPQNESRNEIMAKITQTINNSRPIQFRGIGSVPSSVDEQDKLGIEFVEWASLPQSYYLEEFPLQKRINPYKFFGMRHKNEFFAECHQIAKYLCGLHLKQLIHKREIPYQYVIALLPSYNQEFKEQLAERWQKYDNFIKQQHPFACQWLDDLKKESDDNRNQTDQPVSTETVPEEIR